MLLLGSGAVVLLAPIVQEAGAVPRHHPVRVGARGGSSPRCRGGRPKDSQKILNFYVVQCYYFSDAQVFGLLRKYAC